MASRRARFVGLLTATIATGCGSSREGSLYVGADDAGTFDPGSGDAAGPGAFDAHVEDNHVTVTFVTLGCTNDCATVQAVGTGGYPPYS
ncbi:MAG TPA: hypothetical protein VH044_09980, partial [Polyangiaceae bacterium]|nr:hypothetical protein [Polyangiaceae bacterium]